MIRPTLCVECGPRVEVDEDGCCHECGNGAVGKWLDESHRCTCPHGDANEPLKNHDKACPIRASIHKRVAPEVALDRLAAALEFDPEEEYKKGFTDAICQVERHYERTNRPHLAFEIRKEWSIVWSRISGNDK